jgi:hypothetical protein
MNRILNISAAAILVVGLSACDQLGIGGRRGGEQNVVAPTNTVTTNAVDGNGSGGKDETGGGNGSANAGSVPAAPADGRVTTAFLIGRWTDTGDCTNTVEFRDDGSFVTSQGARGIWALNGDQLTFQGNDAVTATVTAPSGSTIVLTHANGTVGRSTRCTG